jgi:hypothetical protein
MEPVIICDLHPTGAETKAQRGRMTFLRSCWLVVELEHGSQDIHSIYCFSLVVKVGYFIICIRTERCQASGICFELSVMVENWHKLNSGEVLPDSRDQSYEQTWYLSLPARTKTLCN